MIRINLKNEHKEVVEMISDQYKQNTIVFDGYSVLEERTTHNHVNAAAEPAYYLSIS